MSEPTFAVTDENWEDKVLKSDLPVLIDFWAPWCGPCVALGPTLDQIAAEYKGKILVGKMNVDENANIPAAFGIRSIPRLLMFRDGKNVDFIAGDVPKQKIQAMINSALT